MMKLSMPKEQLLAGVNAVIRTVPAKPSNVTLSGIHLKAENGKLTFTATDLAMTTRSILSADVETSGEAVVPAKVFADFVKKLPDTSIVLEVGDSGTMTISYFFSSVDLKCLPVDEFPQAGKVAEEMVAISVGLLRKAIRQTTFATAEGVIAESKPVFSGVLFALTEDGSLDVVATDTHQLALKHSTGVNTSVAKSVIVPSKAVEEVYRLLKNDDEVIQLGFGEDFITFAFGTNQIYSRLLGGTYPPYRNVIPQKIQTKMHLSTKAFADALGRASVLTKTESKVVCFSVSEGADKLVLTSQSDNGKILENVAITNVSGIKTEVAFNASFMAEALKVLDAEEVVLELVGSTGPGVLKAVGDDSYVYLALPVRINAA